MVGRKTHKEIMKLFKLYTSENLEDKIRKFVLRKFNCHLSALTYKVLFCSIAYKIFRKVFMAARSEANH